MVKFPYKKLGGKNHLVLVAVCTALLPLVGFCDFSEEYLKQNFGYLFSRYDLDNVFITNGSSNNNQMMYAIVKTDNNYLSVAAYGSVNTGIIYQQHSLGNLFYYYANNLNRVDKNEFYEYLKSNPEIILSRKNTTYFNMHGIESNYYNYFYTFLRYVNGGELKSYYTINGNKRLSEQFDLYVNQDGDFTITNFQTENFSSVPADGLQEINADYSIDSSNLKQVNEMLKSGQENISFVIGAAIYGVVVFTLLWYSLKWIGQAISDRL